VIERHGGSIINLGKWAERKLAYPIEHHKRATYILSHFECDGTTIPQMRRDAELSEIILRYLITVDQDGVEWTPLDDMTSMETPTTAPGKAGDEKAPATEEKESEDGEKKEEADKEEAETEAAPEPPAEEAASEETPAEESAPAEAKEETPQDE